MAGEITKREAAQELEVSVRSINRYLGRFCEFGPEGLYDHRHSNHSKLEQKDERRIVQAKLEGRHRSARLIRDLLGLTVHEQTVRRTLVKHYLERSSHPPSNRSVALEPLSPTICGRSTFRARLVFL